jgi:putative tryptophan/tyrosine transport system substrate-binding protein
MRRRNFLSVLGGTAAWPLAVRAQQADRVPRIGVLLAHASETDRQGEDSLTAFRDTLQRLGLSDGRHVRIDVRWGASIPDRIRSYAEELVRSTPSVIVVSTDPAAAEMHKLTTTIPIVFTQVADPLGGGLVATIARPGGNVTGFQTSETTIGGKWLGLLKEAAPDMRRAAVVFGSDSTGNLAFLHSVKEAASALGVEITGLDMRGPTELEQEAGTFANQPNGGLVVLPYQKTVANRGSIILLAARYRLPAVYPYRYFAAEGGLMSYGPDRASLIGQWRGAATYVDRILRGEKPSNLPVQAPTKYELVINLKTAKALSLNIPPGFPLLADEVIE